MTNNECRDRLRLAVLASTQRNEASHLIADSVLRLYRAAQIAATTNKHETWGTVGDMERRRKAAAVVRAQKEVNYLFSGLVVEIDADGDPRGYSVKLKGLPINNEMGNDWGLA